MLAQLYNWNWTNVDKYVNFHEKSFSKPVFSRFTETLLAVQTSVKRTKPVWHLHNWDFLKIKFQSTSSLINFIINRYNYSTTSNASPARSWRNYKSCHHALLYWIPWDRYMLSISLNIISKRYQRKSKRTEK